MPLSIKQIKAINIFSLIVLILSFFFLFPSPKDLIGFLLYFLFILIGGYGILICLRHPIKNSIILLLTALLVGITLNSILFFILKYLNIPTLYSLIILLFLGALLLIIKKRTLISTIRSIKILEDPLFPFLVLIILGSFFLISDSLYTTNTDIHIPDTVHHLYQLHISQNINTMNPVPDLSYQEKTFKYHFGVSIMLNQLTQFVPNDLHLTYISMTAFLIILFFLFLFELSKTLKKRSQRLFYILLIAFSSASIATSVILITSRLLNLSIPFIPTAENIFFRLTNMTTYGYGFLFLFALYILWNKKERNYLLETILLTGLAITKASFFVSVFLGYALLLFIELITKRNLKYTILKSMAVWPGALYIFFFVLGTSPHDLWIIFPGALNIRSQTLAHEYLYLNAAISFLLAIILFIGWGFYYLLPKLREAAQKLKRKTLNFNSGSWLIFSIIITSLLFGIFITDAVEGNQVQFILPGYAFLLLLTFNKLIQQPKKIVHALLFLLLLFNAASLFTTSFVYPTVQTLDAQETPSLNNPFANLKQLAIRDAIALTHTDRITTYVHPACSYSNNFINALRFLSTQSKGTFIHSRWYEPCENDPRTTWSTSTTFIRTAISGQQALLENHKYKGINSHPQYCNRTYETLLFYDIILGEDDKNSPQQFLNAFVSPIYSNLSYKSYFGYYSPHNYYTGNQNFVDCMQEKIQTENNDNEQQFLRHYITRYNITYILFERGDTPTQEYVSQLGLEYVYVSEDVTIYSLN